MDFTKMSVEEINTLIADANKELRTRYTKAKNIEAKIEEQIDAAAKYNYEIEIIFNDSRGSRQSFIMNPGDKQYGVIVR